MTAKIKPKDPNVTNFLLYAATVLIWGSTWLGIHFQLGVVPLEWSVAYRMTFAALVMLAFCLITRRSLRFNRGVHIRFAAMGLFLFSFNYLLMYHATAYIASGLVAITFCTIIILNIVNSALIFKSPLQPRVLVGAVLGLCGISVIFWPELDKLTFADKTFMGLTMALVGTIFASIGNMISVSLQKSEIPVLPANAWGLSYGAFFVTLSAIFQGHAPVFDFSTRYVVSFLFLSLFGTVIAFYTYLTLLGRIGADRTAYSSVLYLVVALSLSTLFEDYHWTKPAIAGVILVVIGNVIVLSRRREPQTAAA